MTAESRFQSITNTSVILFEPYKFETYPQICVSEEEDTFVFSILFLLSDLYKFLDAKERHLYRRQLYEKLVTDYDTKNLYKEFNYQKKRLNRGGMKANFISYSRLELMGQTLFMDYFKLNIFVYDASQKTICPYLQYYDNDIDNKNKNKNYCGIVLDYTKHTFSPMGFINENSQKTTHQMIPNNIIKNMIESGHIDMTIQNPFLNQKLKSLSAYKLPQLQELAKGFSIELTKIINGKDKRKTKKDLFEELQAIYNMTDTK